MPSLVLPVSCARRPRTVRRGAVDHLAGAVGEEELARHLASAVEEDRVVNVRRPAAVPAGPDRLEPGDATRVGELRAAQEGLAAGVERPVAALPREPRVVARRIAVPDVDPRTLDRPAVLVDHLQHDPQRRAGPPLGDVRADEVRVEVVRPRRRSGVSRQTLGATSPASAAAFAQAGAKAVPKGRIARARKSARR